MLMTKPVLQAYKIVLGNYISDKNMAEKQLFNTKTEMGLY